MQRVLVIGAGVAGLTAAGYASRAGCMVTMLEKTAPGGQIMQASSVENFPSVPEIPGWELAERLLKQAKAQGAEILSAKARKIIVGEYGFTVKTEGENIFANAVVVAVGGARKKLDCPGAEKFDGRGVSFCAVCDGNFFRGKAVCVVGGGNSALEETLYLAELCEKVYLVVRRRVRGEEGLFIRVKNKTNVMVLSPFEITEIYGDKTVSGITLENKETGEVKNLAVSAVFTAIGVQPDTEFCRDIIKTDEYGYFPFGEDCRTNIPGIFAAGDCRRKPLYQLVSAMSDGAVAGTGAADYALKKAADPGKYGSGK